MNKVEIIDGYVEFPEDWIVVDYQQPNQSQYVGVVEILGGTKYNAPHFIFFSLKQIKELTLNDECTIILSCIRRYPQLKHILSHYIPLKRNENGQTINGLDWLESPLPGCCPIAEFGSRTDYPYNAMIIRTPHGGSR